MEFDFEPIFRAYPNREGKGIGMKRLATSVKTEEDFNNFKIAMEIYLEICRRTDRIDRGYVLMWKTFCTNWRDYLDPTLIPGEPRSKNIAQLERITQGKL